MALAHNGNLTNAGELRRELEMSGAIFHTTNDYRGHRLHHHPRTRSTPQSIEEALAAAMNAPEGRVFAGDHEPHKSCIAARDPQGFRPLCIGQARGGRSSSLRRACALDAIGAHLVRDVEPGEIVVVDENGLRSIRTHCAAQKTRALRV